MSYSEAQNNPNQLPGVSFFSMNTEGTTDIWRNRQVVRDDSTSLN